MGRLTVEVDEDHLARLVKGPKVGLAELVWNSLDADADNVDITIYENAIGTIESVMINDDGHGMRPDEIAQGFGALGGSWKKTAYQTKNQRRRLHGEQGKGRFAAFGIGGRVTWTSVYDDDGTSYEVHVRGSISSLREFDISEPISTDKATGTVVRIDSISENSVKFLARPSLADNLTAEFAIYLEKYPRVRINYRGAQLEPSAIQRDRVEYELEVSELSEYDFENAAAPSLVIIEWLQPIDRALYLCNADGMAQSEVKPGIHAPGFQFTAYLSWAGFSGHDVLLAELGAEPMASVLDVARDTLRDHFKELARKRQQAVIKEWIEEGIYPYESNKPQSAIETAERQVFDVVAFTASATVNKGETESKKLSLRLLREALESNPRNLHKVLNNVLELSDETLEDLTQLLEKTSLGAIINTARKIGDRLSFLSGLDSILFDAESKRETLERRQLHRILANETWIFGEEYALTGDDESLTKVLQKYLNYLGDDVELADNKPVLRHDGSNPIPDLVLSRTSEIAQDRVENLVVELKRPKVVLGSKELMQIEEYALAVTRDERFVKPNVTWDFWIIGNQLDEFVESRRNQTGLPFGYIQRTPKYSVQVRTWSEVINDARHRLKFVERGLNYRATHDDGVEYLQKTHSKYLPESLTKGSTGSPSDSTSSGDGEGVA